MPNRRLNDVFMTIVICVRRNMETQRITIRLPQQYISSIDLFVTAGEFATRSEVIRHAVNDFIKNYANSIIDKAEKIKKVQELKETLESVEPYMKK
jgi:Arc/MetJ-type ribon-helix-helix transcriptional regulator